MASYRFIMEHKNLQNRYNSLGAVLARQKEIIRHANTVIKMERGVRKETQAIVTEQVGINHRLLNVLEDVQETLNVLAGRVVHSGDPGDRCAHLDGAPFHTDMRCPGYRP